jgi:hypothetical protein
VSVIAAVSLRKPVATARDPAISGYIALAERNGYLDQAALARADVASQRVATPMGKVDDTQENDCNGAGLVK